MINKEGLAKLLENYVYAILEVHGRDTSLEQLKEILIKSDVILIDDDQLISDTYDLMTDIYDDNIQFQTAPVTHSILKLLSDCMVNQNYLANAAPNLIEEAVFELMVKQKVDERTADSVSKAIYSISCDLAKDIGEYI